MVFYLPVISLLSSVILLSSCGNACNLLPGSPEGSCLELRATPYITSASSQFGNFIEGASVNPRGDIFAVNYGQPTPQNQLGQVYPSQGLFYADEVVSSLLNGIRFLNSSRAYVVDAVNHRVLQLDVNVENVVTASRVFCSDQQMLQPNDLTLSIRAGTVITSGMRWLADSDDTHGDLYSCLADGRVKKLEVMGRTNGIDLSPDENTLYVSESYNRGGVPYVQKIWKYNVDVNEGTINGKTLFADFAAVDGSVSVDIDGMKTDSLGNLYVTRHGGSEVVIFSPAGAVIGKIALNFPNPTNLEFGGPTGTSLFVVGKCGDSDNKGCVDKIEVANPGRTWSLLQN